MVNIFNYYLFIWSDVWVFFFLVHGVMYEFDP